MPRAATFLLFAVVLASCGEWQPAPPPPTRSSPELTRIALDGRVHAVDFRNGALLFGDTELSVGHVVDDHVEALTPALPSSDPSHSTVVWFTDAGWVTAGDTFRFAADAWTLVPATDCDPASASASLTLLDARAIDDVWALAEPSTLCHLDGATWSAETLPFTLTTLVALEGELVAMGDDENGTQLFHRSSGESAWEVVALRGPPTAIGARADGVALRLLVGRAFVHGFLGPDGVPEDLGLDEYIRYTRDERWTVTLTVGQADRSDGVSTWDRRWAWTQYVLFRGADTSDEIGHANALIDDVGLYNGAFFFPLGPGRMAIAAGDGLWAMD